MAAVDTSAQSRLAASLPSMFMNYLTGGAGAATTTITTTPPPRADSGLAGDSSSASGPGKCSNNAEPTYTTPSNNRIRPSILHTPHSGVSSRAQSPTKSFPSMLLDESENMSYASGDLSREGSFRSTNGKTRKRTSRPKTSYTICQPPPKSHARQIIHVRARPLLQLHKLNGSSRPVPAFELLPSAIFSPSLSRAISKAFRAKHGLCPTDLAIVKADLYHQHEESGTEEDESRDVLALICKGRKGDGLAPGRAKIFLDNGTEWEAMPLPNGSYEFSSTDVHGLTTTARWVLKRPRGRRSQSATDLDSPRIETATKKFNFSTISSSSRRHPIIANLTSTTLDISDSYNVPLPSAPNLSPSAVQSPDENDYSRGESIETTLELRTLITATAIWVGIREGWSPGYKYEDCIMRSPSSRLSTSPTKNNVTDRIETSKDNGPRRSNSIARIFRTASTMKRRSTASAATDGSNEDVVMSRNSSVHSNSAPRRRPRAESAATVIHRTTWPRPEYRNMRNHTGNTTSTHGFGLEQGDEMTEEDEGEVDSAVDTSATPSKHGSVTAPIVVPSIEKDHEPKGITPIEAFPEYKPTPKKNKRNSSATDMTVESKKSEDHLQMRRKRGKALRVLLCGMA